MKRLCQGYTSSPKSPLSKRKTAEKKIEECLSSITKKIIE